jgi:hypothetical protein
MSATADEYLAAIRLLEPGERDSDLQKRLKVLPSQVTRWRKKTPGFRAEESRIRARRKAVYQAEQKGAGVKREAGAQQAERRRIAAAARAGADLAAGTAAPGTDDGAPLDPRMEAFLAALREHDDRADALQAAGIERWQEVQDYAVAEPRFAAHYANVIMLQLFRVEDAVRRKGAKGDIKAAQIFLQGADPTKYSTKVQVNHGGVIALVPADVQAQEHWLSSFRKDAKPVRQLAAAAAALQEA